MCPERIKSDTYFAFSSLISHPRPVLLLVVAINALRLKPAAMWEAIKTDLSEFLTSASAEGESVLNSLDQSIDSLDDNLIHSTVEAQNNAIDSNDIYIHDYEESSEVEAVRLAGMMETYTEPLVREALDRSDLKDLSYETNDTSCESFGSEDDEELFDERQVEKFLDEFNLGSHTEEILQLLHPLVPLAFSENDEHHIPRDDDQGETAVESQLTPLQIQYKQLVPRTITHEQFWTRYYFRCSPALISERNEYRAKIQKRRRQMGIMALNETALNIGKSAASLFKNVSGVVGAVGESLGEATKELRMHHPSGRPPFVRTALDEDDDEYIEGEEASDDEQNDSEEEASLGWGSESEEEVCVGGEDGSIHDEVAFGIGTPMHPTPLKFESIDIVKLRRTLMQAENERNNMMQMVEERNEEIVRLKCFLEEKCRADPCNVDATLDQLQHVAGRLRTATALKGAQAIINGMKKEIEDIKFANAAAELRRLHHDEGFKHKDLRTKLDKLKHKIEQLELQKQKADERISRLIQQKQDAETSV